MFVSLIVCLLVAYAAGQCPPPCSCAPPCPRGVYQVCLDHCGPEPCPAPPVQAPPVCAKPIEKPTVALPACIPAPKIIGASASCVKTYLKPQLYHQLVSVPVISKYLQTLTKPVVETITFDAVPVCSAPAPACLPPPACYSPPSPYQCY